MLQFLIYYRRLSKQARYWHQTNTEPEWAILHQVFPLRFFKRLRPNRPLIIQTATNASDKFSAGPQETYKVTKANNPQGKASTWLNLAIYFKFSIKILSPPSYFFTSP